MSLIYLIEDVPELRVAISARIRKYGRVIGFDRTEDVFRFLDGSSKYVKFGDLTPDLVITNDYNAIDTAGVSRPDELIPELRDRVTDLKRIRVLTNGQAPIIFYSSVVGRSDIGQLARELYESLIFEEGDIISKVSKDPPVDFKQSFEMVEERVRHYLEGVRV